ncbi:hypothetical protein HDU93_009267 [Gonapodya sp. JEL0774]|nr:hypothetical protein HDU93_009267 [Gonapodya sp. JEL0774]
MGTTVPLLTAFSTEGSEGKMAKRGDTASTSQILIDSSGETADGTSFTERSVGFIKKLSLSLSGKLPGSSDRYTRIGFVLSIAQVLVGVAIILSILVFHLKLDTWILDYYRVFQSSGDVEQDDLYEVQSYALALKVYHVLFLGTQCFQFYLYIDSIVFSNTMELLTLFVFLAISFGYACVNVVQEKSLVAEIAGTFENFEFGDRYTTHHNLGFGILATNGLFLLLWIFIGSQVYLKMGWLMFRQTGADLQKRRRYIYHHLLQLLLKLDVFFFIGFAIQYFVLVVLNPKYSYPVGTTVGFGVVAIGGAFFIVSLGLISVRSQSAVQLSVFVVLCVAAFGYLGSVLFDLFGRNDSVKQRFTGSREGLAVFVCGTMFMILFTVVLAVVNGYYYVVGPVINFKELSRTQNEKEIKKIAKEEGQWDID